MKNFIKLLPLLIFIFSCKPETNKDFKKLDNKNQVFEDLNKDYKLPNINFLEEKYKVNGYNLPDYSPTFPSYSFTNKELGIFSVNYIGKSKLIQDYWNVTNSTGFFSQFQDINAILNNSKLKNEKINEVLKSKQNEYYIIADFLPKEEVLQFSNDGSGEFELKENANNYFYVYENNKWVFVKKLSIDKIKKEGIDLYNDLLLAYKFKNSSPISEKFQGKFSAEVDGESTTQGTGHTTYNFAITKNKIELNSITFMGDFLCEGEYTGVEMNNILEIYYDENDDRCIKLKPNYLLKIEEDKYFIKGVGGEGTINKWIKLKKE